MRKEITAIYPGTFDPITNGNIDIVKSAGNIFSTVIVTVAPNPKKDPLFSTDERLEMIHDALKRFPNVRVEQVDGLLVNFALKNNATVIIRELRAISDFEY